MRLRQPDTDDGARAEALALLEGVQPGTESYHRLLAVLEGLVPLGCIDLLVWRLPHGPEGAREMVKRWLE